MIGDRFYGVLGFECLEGFEPWQENTVRLPHELYAVERRNLFFRQCTPMLSGILRYMGSGQKESSFF